VLWFVVVCCGVLQCVAVCCSVLQCVAVCGSVLQCVAVCSSVLQCVAVCCSVLQCAAVCWNVLQCVTSAVASGFAMLWRSAWEHIYSSVFPWGNTYVASTVASGCAFGWQSLVGTHLFIRVLVREHLRCMCCCIWLCVVSGFAVAQRVGTHIYSSVFPWGNTYVASAVTSGRALHPCGVAKPRRSLFVPVREHTYLYIYMREGSKEVPWIYIYICSESQREYVYVCVCIYMCMCVFPQGFSLTHDYGVALVSRIDKIICLFCKRAL